MNPTESTPVPATTPSPHDPPPGARLMNALRWVLFVVLVVVAIASITGYVASRRAPARSGAVSGAVLWQCPMHPNIVADHPGECPICGMSLVKVAASSVPGHDGPAGDVPGLTSVTLGPERVQMIGVRTARVERGDVGAQLDLVGFVTPDESRLKRVHLRVAGWVRQLYANETGMRLAAGQPLLALYSPELFQSEQEYLVARGASAMPSMEGMDAPGGESNAAAERLRLLGVPEEEIRRLDREGRASDRLVLRAPVSGTVLERGVVEGQYVGADTPLLTLADLTHVWVMADLYEMDVARVLAGDVAVLEVDALPGRTFPGRIEFVYPTVSNATRTLKARIALANPGGVLRPGMYGRVRVEGRGGRGLLVPDEAVVRAGEHTYVFLAHAGGRFEPRLVRTGTARGDRVQLLDGVAEGDTVVASASFLIDSESRLKAAIEGLGATSGESTR